MKLHLTEKQNATSEDIAAALATAPNWSRSAADWINKLAKKAMSSAEGWWPVSAATEIKYLNGYVMVELRIKMAELYSSNVDTLSVFWHVYAEHLIDRNVTWDFCDKAAGLDPKTADVGTLALVRLARTCWPPVASAAKTIWAYPKPNSTILKFHVDKNGKLKLDDF